MGDTINLSPRWGFAIFPNITGVHTPAYSVTPIRANLNTSHLPPYRGSAPPTIFQDSVLACEAFINSYKGKVLSVKLQIYT